MKLLLVDGSALLHRAYHAYPPLTSKSGQVVGAVYGVASMLYSATVEVAPTHVVVAWDLPKPTFRHEKYVGYKAQRKKADTEMVEQIPLVKDLIKAMNVVQMEQEGYEADDIIGTLAAKFSNPEFPARNAAHSAAGGSNYQIGADVVILTGDQDTMQLVSEQVRILTPPKGQIPAKLYGVDEVREKYGVWPSQIVDYKALIGDPSDNIPGVAGIGPKTASNLLKTFTTLERIYEELNSPIPNSQILKLKDKLQEGKDSAFLSQDLSRIVTDMPLSVTLEQLEAQEIKNEALRAELESLGFKSLIRRIWSEEVGEKKSKKTVDTNQMGLF